ncbi:MAG: hypothetical protein KDJ99_03810, partial [Candidatus Competibacteraceae bacterium]|nr:hypothetical protein [Candidatus Competibacteraceae bacterium]
MKRNSRKSYDILTATASLPAARKKQFKTDLARMGECCFEGRSDRLIIDCNPIVSILEFNKWTNKPKPNWKRQ